jgi:hypothetical protein
MSNGILIERLDGMDFETYKAMRSRQNKNIRKRNKGKITVLKVYKKKK